MPAVASVPDLSARRRRGRNAALAVAVSAMVLLLYGLAVVKAMGS